MTKLLALALCAAAVPASAQIHVESPNPAPAGPPGDVFLPNSAENLGAKELRLAMVKFGRCVAGRHPKEASDFVLNPSQTAWVSLEKKMDDDCALAAVENPGDEVTVSTNSRDLLFALAEALVQKKLTTFEPTQIASAAKLPLGDPLATVGECAVRANPAGARNLLKTRLNSKDEGQAVQALMPAFANCIPAGQRVRFDITSLRGTVAVNYYRLAFAPKVPQPEQPK